MEPAIEEMVKSLNDVAAYTVRWHQEAWGRGGSEGYDASMIRCGNGDAADFRRIGTLLRKGQFTKAAEFASHMDTCPRESIPDKVWDFLETFRQ